MKIKSKLIVLLLMLSFNANSHQLKEPLEYFDLNNIKLLCIVPDIKWKNAIIIEDPTKELRKVTVGNYIGKNHGKIVEINIAGYIIVEEVIKEAKNKKWIMKNKRINVKCLMK